MAVLAIGGVALVLAALRPEVGAVAASVPAARAPRAEPEAVSLAVPEASAARVDPEQAAEAVRERDVGIGRRELYVSQDSRAPRRRPVRAPPAAPAVLPVKVVSTSGVPLRGARVFYEKSSAWRSADPVDPEDPQALLAEWVEREVPSGRDLRLQAVFLAGPVGRASVEVSALTPGLNAGVVIAIDTEPLRPYCGRVFVADTGEPVSNAHIAVRDTRASRCRHWVFTRRHTFARARTDATGRFEVELPPWEELELGVRAHGYTPRALALASEGHETLRFEQAIELERSAQVVARVFGAEGDPIQGITVRFSSDSFDAAEASGEEPGATEWQSVTDVEGVCYLDGVPTGVFLDVECLRLEQVLWSDSDSVLLYPGETTELELALP